MRCPRCGATTKLANDVRAEAVADGAELRRIRVCGGAEHHRFVTHERPEVGSVRKQSGGVEDFDRSKLTRGLLAAINKRPVDHKAIHAFVDEIAAEVGSAGELETQYIGEQALALLQKLDDVAYVRFLSVYREFDSLDQFRQEIARLKPSVLVHKSRGKTEPFDRAKLLNGLLRAANRRENVKYSDLEGIVDRISTEAAARSVVSSSEIGEQAMQGLRDLDEVAYIRFASVYRNFDSVDDFLTALGDLRNTHAG
jgi:transcriptional repressor NrdR